MVEEPAIGRRFDPRVEAAANFCVAEATRELEAPVGVRHRPGAAGEALSVGGRAEGAEQGG